MPPPRRHGPTGLAAQFFLTALVLLVAVRLLQGERPGDLLTHPSRLWRDVISFQPTPDHPLVVVPDHCPLPADPDRRPDHREQGRVRHVPLVVGRHHTAAGCDPGCAWV